MQRTIKCVTMDVNQVVHRLMVVLIYVLFFLVTVSTDGGAPCRENRSGKHTIKNERDFLVVEIQSRCLENGRPFTSNIIINLLTFVNNSRFDLT